MVQPAVLRSGFEHCVLTTDLVGKGRYFELVLDAAYHVQIRHAGLDHHHVRALGNVHGDFTQGFVDVARIHLVDLFVGLAQVACGADRIAKRAIKSRCIFGAVGHDAGVDQTL